MPFNPARSIIHPAVEHAAQFVRRRSRRSILRRRRRLFLRGLVLAGLTIGVILAAVFSEHCRTNPPQEFDSSALVPVVPVVPVVLVTDVAAGLQPGGPDQRSVV